MIRRIIQYLCLSIFVVLFVGSRRGGLPADLVNIPVRLDPLLVISHLLASRTFLVGSLLAILTILLTMIFGRAWCGWICPQGTILDIVSLKSLRTKIPGKQSAPSSRLRSIKYLLLFTILFASLFGNLTLLFLDPITILLRTLTVSLWPAVDVLITSAETFLYPIPFLSDPVSKFDAFIRPEVLPSEPVYYRSALVYGAIFLGIIILNLTAERFWCRYLCPLGGLLGLLSKISIFRREVSQDCKGCSVCVNHCPTGTIDAKQAYTSDPAECTMCLECINACPRGQTVFKPRFSPAKWYNYDPERHQILTTFGITMISIALLGVDAKKRHQDSHLIHPPGASGPDFVSQCVRCGECMRTCPTSALQPAWNEAGLEGLWTPVIVPRLGYCDYSCNACGQVCPVQAIPRLDLDNKRKQIIGKAYIDQDRCIAWSDHKPCIVCEEMCPVPEKTIYLEAREITLIDGSHTIIHLPHIDRDKCIGCGICEYKCPVIGESAVRVFTPSVEVV